MKLISDILPKPHKVPKDMYQSKKMMSAPSLKYEKVMTEVTQKQLHYFPITPRLKRVFISKRTVRHMRWHKESICENNGVMGHPSDGEACKVLERFDVDFANDTRNAHFGLTTDGFDPFSTSTNSTTYSCWPVFAVPHNLPPSLCMKFEFMFLCLIVPGTEAPGRWINVMLKPLIQELK
jgi:hypothetical protein